MLPFRALMDVWPENEETKVFLCLENRKTGTMNWIYKGPARDAISMSDIQELQEAPIKDAIKAGPVQYIYMDEDRARQFQQAKIDRGTQLSLFAVI